MNHYPHHLGDYLKDTFGLSQGEHGAYLLLMFAAYSSESGIDPAEVYAITKAANPAERKNTDRVLKKYWGIGEDGLYHQRRIDEEIAEYQVKAERNRVVGKSGGRPRKNPDRNLEETQTVSETKPRPNPEETLASNQKPVKPKPLSVQHSPGDGGKPDSAGTFAAAALQNLKPMTLDEARIETSSNPDAVVLSSLCIANGIRVNPFHPLCIEWVRLGITDARMRDAIATARMRKPKPQAIPAAYIDAILRADEQPVDNRWRSDDHEAERLCSELGIPGAKVNEQRPDFHARINAALMSRARSQVQ